MWRRLGAFNNSKHQTPRQSLRRIYGGSSSHRYDARGPWCRFAKGRLAAGKNRQSQMVSHQINKKLLLSQTQKYLSSEVKCFFGFNLFVSNFFWICSSFLLRQRAIPWGLGTDKTQDAIEGCHAGDKHIDVSVNISEFCVEFIFCFFLSLSNVRCFVIKDGNLQQ